MAKAKTELAELNAADRDAFVAAPSASEAEPMACIRGHPEVDSNIARSGALTHALRQEQGNLGLDCLSGAELQRLERLNGDYRQRFGMPFIICGGRHTRPSILRELARRIANGWETVADLEARYHAPLLAAPWAYSTCRGS